jgi:glycosyltransferase involved in cell wall biosynthesis
MAIEIVDALRARGLQVGLTIIGAGEGGYARSIVEMAATRQYVTLHSNLSRVEMEQLASTHKWAIHCAPNEHYGLAAIELIRLGCIVFVPDNGGQAEVVDDARLRYLGPTDATDKMERVMRSADLQVELRSLLNRVAETHTIEQFQSNFLQYVFGVLNEQPNKD